MLSFIKSFVLRLLEKYLKILFHLPKWHLNPWEYRPKINGKFGAKYRVTLCVLDRPDGMIGKK